MPANNRIFYASQAVKLQPCNSDLTTLGSTYTPQGLQSVGMTTNIGLEQVFQLGQIELYDNVENVPEVQVTINKVLDGTAPLYLMCMGGSAGITGAVNKEITELATNRVNFSLGIYKDTTTAATGTAPYSVMCSGMYLSSINYNFPVEGTSTEEIQLVGNSKVWSSGGFSTGEFDTQSPYTTGARTPKSFGTVRRALVNIDASTLPVGSGGGIRLPDTRSEQRPYINNITISSNLGREAIYELGKMAPYFRYVNFPLEVTSEFTVTASDGDWVDASDFSDKSGCLSYNNLQDKSIRIVVCGTGAGSSMSIDLGNKNKLTSVNYSGGDTGGGNATITYSYQTFNKFVISASGSFTTASHVDGTFDSDNYG